MKGFKLSLGLVASLYTVAFCVALISLPHSAHADLTSGLVGHWTFDGADTQSTIADVSGQGNAGYVQGAATSSEKIAGVLGQALNFDTTDSIHIPNGTPYDFTNGTFSVAAWIKPNNGLSSALRIVDHQGGCGSGWTFEYEDGSFNGTKGLAIQLNGTDFPTSTSNVISLGKWQHVGFTDNAGSITFYVNGVAAGSTTTTPLPLAASADLVIGGRTCDTTRNWNGAIDDVRVYNRTLSAAEMQRLYISGQALHKPPNNLGLIGYWPMNEGSGLKAGDFSGFGHSGTLTGTPVPSWVNGQRGGALKFDGSQNYVPAGNIAAMNGLTKITVAAWTKSSSPGVNGDGRAIIDKSACSGLADDGPFEIFEDTTVSPPYRANFAIYVQGQAPFGFQNSGTNGTADIDDAKWHFVVGEYDGNDVSVWVDGKEDSHQTIGAVTLTSTSTVFSIGGDCSLGNPVGGTQLYNGTIDDVRVYNRALGASDIATLYAQGTAGATQVNASSASLDAGTTLGTKGGLVGHWTFDGADVTDKIYDRSGQSNNGYASSSQATSSMKVAGKLGQALNFDGITSSIAITGSQVYAPSASPFSVAAWVNLNSIANTNAFIATLKSDAGGPLYFFIGKTGVSSWPGISICFGDNDNSHAFNTFADFAPNLGSWHHIAATYNGSGMGAVGNYAVYLDGAAQTLSANGQGCGVTTNATRIGSDGSGSSDPFNLFSGKMDDVHIYNRALTASEVATLFKLGSAIINK